MALVFVQNGQGSNDASGSSIAASLTGVGAGNLIPVFVSHFGAPTTITVSDGTTSLTALTKHDHTDANKSGQWFYLLVANGGSKTYTATLGAARAFRRIEVWEYSYSGTISFDQENSDESNGGTASITSGNITTTGTDEVVLAGFTDGSAGHSTGEQINGVTFDNELTSGSNVDVWDRVVTATFTGQATGTANSGFWLCVIASFKAVAAKGAGPFTELSVMATPGMIHSFLAKTAADEAADVFFENRHPISQGMKPLTAAGLGGILIDD